MKSGIDKYSTIPREIIIETDNLGIITFVRPNCINISNYDQNEIVNTDIKNYINYDFNTITVNRTFKSQITKKSGDEVYFDISRLSETILELLSISGKNMYKNRKNNFLLYCDISRIINNYRT